MKLSIDEQIKIIKKGIADLINEEELKQKLIESEKNNTPLNIKLGLDPTAPDIHLGHTVVLRKIKQFQDLGHQAIIIIGDFTGKIGDPTGKSKTRLPLTEEQIIINAKTYTEQIFKVIDPNKTTVRFNSEWLSKLTFEDIIKISANTTVARLIERDDFHKRYTKGEPIGLHEFFYPIMQAYDSIEIKSDVELGGTDQTFNILMGRTMQKAVGMSQQIAMFVPILEGLDGIEKMSKSLGNYIGISEPAEVMFKKVMEVPDNLIIRYFELVTDEHPDRINEIKEEMKNGRNPRDIKLELADIITSLYHGNENAKKAAEYFNTVFQKGALPDDMLELEASSDQYKELFDIASLLVDNKLVQTNSEFRRLVKQGGVQMNQEKTNDLNAKLPEEFVLKIGKKKFVKIKLV
ncbi:MAG TPA: tyrosine--tRNA ligase [Clostridiales bacterium]|nr:tyrosine--tRNA ligase [Clostridiales bacterium]